MYKLALAIATLAIAATTAQAQLDYGFVTRPHKGHWQVACFAVDAVPPSKVIRWFLTTPWEGRFSSKAAAESYAKANVDCDY